MGKRGPPPTPPNVLHMRGTTQPCRERDYVVGDVGGEVTVPGYLKAKQRRKFEDLVSKFSKRGQRVVGLEDMIGVYACELVRWEDDMRKGNQWTASEKNALRSLATQFYDTAASQVSMTKEPDKGNRFGSNGTKAPGN